MTVPPEAIKATVIDIRKPYCPLPDHLIFDAQVLHFLHYPGFDQLRRSGGSPPKHYQQTAYEAFVARARRAAKTQCYVTAITLGEVLRTFEFVELEILAREDPDCDEIFEGGFPARFTPVHCKEIRYHFSANLAATRKVADDLLIQLMKHYTLLNLPPAKSFLDMSRLDWMASKGDFADSAMMAIARLNQKSAILSDDIDLATFEGITLYTANLRAIEAAKQVK